jgi:putative endonuclease
VNFFTYIVECSDGSFYTGWTDDVEARVSDHNEGVYPRAYTKSRRPVKLVFSYRFPDAESAKQFERQIKGWRREKKIALINGEWNKLPELSINYSRDN